MGMAEKNEAPEYIFFIFDDNVMQQSEYDDIEEAILFYQPKPSFLDDDDQQIYLLFGHIVGIVKCTETLTGSLPSMIHLEKTKFAVIRNTHYLFFLGYNSVSNNIPDSCIKRQLKKFIDVFSFYHGSFERLISTNKNDRTEFLVDLEYISSNYLAFAQGYDDPIQSIFDPLPTVVFDRSSSSIFSKVAQILEACQRSVSVYSGCMFAESRVITSQVPSNLVYNLILLKANQKNKHVSIFHPGFDCPLGVRILQVYVTQQQYEEIVNSSHTSTFKERNYEISASKINEVSPNPSHKKVSDRTLSSTSSVVSSRDDGSLDTKSLTNDQEMKKEK